MKKKRLNSSPSNPNCSRCFQVINTKEKVCSRCQLKTDLQLMMKVNLISPENVPQILRYLELPDEIDKLSFRQVKKIQRILHQIKAGSFDLRILKINQSRNNSADKRTNFQITEPESNLKRNRHSNKRPNVNPELVQFLQKREQNRCYWCQIKVIKIADVPPADRLELKSYTLLYFDGIEIREDAIATVDHLVKYAEGGSLKPQNTVLSCFKCNNERNLEEQKQQLKNRICFFCGKKYNDLKNLRCSSCLEEFGLMELIAQPSTENIQENKKSIWKKIKEAILKVITVFQK